MTDCSNWKFPNIGPDDTLNSYTRVKERFEARVRTIENRFRVEVVDEYGVVQGHQTLTRAGLAATYGDAFYFQRGQSKKFIKVFLSDKLANTPLKETLPRPLYDPRKSLALLRTRSGTAGS